MFVVVLYSRMNTKNWEYLRRKTLNVQSSREEMKFLGEIFFSYFVLLSIHFRTRERVFCGCIHKHTCWIVCGRRVVELGFELEGWFSSSGFLCICGDCLNGFVVLLFQRGHLVVRIWRQRMHQGLQPGGFLGWLQFFFCFLLNGFIVI